MFEFEFDLLAFDPETSTDTDRDPTLFARDVVLVLFCRPVDTSAADVAPEAAAAPVDDAEGPRGSGVTVDRLEFCRPPPAPLPVIVNLAVALAARRLPSDPAAP